MNLSDIRPELQAWILSTARAGHPPQDVVKLMTNSGYELAMAQLSVARVLNLPLPSSPPIVPSDGMRTRHPVAPNEWVNGHEIRVSMSVEAPPIRVLDGLLTGTECDELITQAQPRLKRSLTVGKDGGQQPDYRRTSQGMFFGLGETPLVQRIETRIAELLGMPVDHGEGLQVLHYQPGQEYEPHFDWFDPEQPGFAAVTRMGGQRIATVVMYLNTPAQGGGTAFPTLGLTVTAMRGSAVYFAYEGGDRSSLHAGLPVLRGEKWIATKWLRERPYRP